MVGQDTDDRVAKGETGGAEPGAWAARTLGRYELIRPLAKGGMAELFLGRVTSIEGFSRVVVVKRMLPGMAADPEAVQLFLHEARLAATLQHPNIVHVYDVGQVGQEYFFSMEYLHGQDLRSVIRAACERHAVPLEHALTIALGACAGLHHAHEKTDFDGRPLGIVHRDVSPSNIFVTYDGCPKVLDFGIAKANTQAVETRAGLLRGKISYMSPEQCLLEPLDRRSDIFSLGIVLWELTTCSKLFRGKSDYEIMRQIVENRVPAPSRHVAGYPRELERIVLKALANDRDQRYATAREMQIDLEQVAHEQGLATSPVALCRYMEGLFQKDLAAWKESQRAGLDLVDHLTRVARPKTPLPRTCTTVRKADRTVPTVRRRRWHPAYAIAEVALLVGLGLLWRAAPMEKPASVSTPLAAAEPGDRPSAPRVDAAAPPTLSPTPAPPTAAADPVRPAARPGRPRPAAPAEPRKPHRVITFDEL